MRPIYPKLTISVFIFSLSLLIHGCEDEAESLSPDIKGFNLTNEQVLYEVILVQWSVFDAEGIEKSELWLNGSPFINDSSVAYESRVVRSDNLTITEIEYTMTWNTMLTEDGQYEISVMAIDKNGNSSFSNTINITIDNSLGFPPTGQIIKVNRQSDTLEVLWKKESIHDFRHYLIEIAYDSQMVDIFTLDTIQQISDTLQYYTQVDQLKNVYVKMKIEDIFGKLSSSTIFSVLGDAYPVASTINIVDYNLDSLTVDWTESIDNDFLSYTLFRSYTNGDPGEEIFTTNQKNITKYSLNNFDPNQLNWFSVVTKDILGLETRSSYTANDINLPPESSRIISIDYDLDSMVVHWEPNGDYDFKNYTILVSTNQFSGYSPLHQIFEYDQTELILNEFDPTVENWFKVKTEDHWALSSEGAPTSNHIDPLPSASEIRSLDYDLDSMRIVWDACSDEDFFSYNLLQSLSENGEYNLIYTSGDLNDTTYSLYDFDPTIENWFKVQTTDAWSQEIVGEPMVSAIDAFPIVPAFNSISYETNNFTIAWETASEIDFLKYDLYISFYPDMADKLSVFSSANPQDTSFVYPTQENIIGYFQLGVTDVWEQESLGEPLRGSSFNTFRTIYENEQADQGISVVESSIDNQYLIAGISSSFGDFGFDGFLTKVDNDGQFIWLEVFGGINPESIHDFSETPDGGLLLIGSTESYGSSLKDILAAKFDQNGEQEWVNTYGGNDQDEGKAVYTREDGVSYIIGNTRSYGNGETDIWLIIIDEQGNEISSFTYGSELNDYGVGIVSNDIDELVIISNEEMSGFSEQKIAARKIDSDGLELWHNFHQSQQLEASSEIVTDGEGYYYIIGSTTYGGQKDGLFLSLDENGNFVSTNTFGGGYNDWFSDLIITVDGHLLVCGTFEEDNYNSWIVKIDYNGNQLWSRNLGFEGMDYANGISEASDGGFLITGTVQNQNNNNDYFLIKTDSEGMLESIE